MSESKAVVAVREETAVATAKDHTESIRRAMVERLPSILPNGMKPERFEAVTIQAIAKNPDLMACDPTSVVLAVLEAAQLGLEPTGSLSRAWLVPYQGRNDPKPKAQLMIGYQGLIDLARRSGEVSKVWSRVVYEGDDFAVTYGLFEGIHHIPLLGTTDPTQITHVYAIALLRDGSTVFDVMTKAQVDAIRARSRSANRGPWVTDYAEMGRKTVARRLVKSLPLTAEVIDAIERDAEREFGGIPSDGDVKVAESRTATVRGMLAARAGAPTPTDAPGAPEGEPVAATSAPEASAAQQTAEAAGDDPGGAAEGANAEVCGATSDPALGPAETCIEPPGHARDRKPSPHKSAAGSIWPNTGS